MTEDGRKPTLEQLRSYLGKPATDKFTLKPSIARAIPTPTTLQEARETLGDEASEFFPDGIDEPQEVTREIMEEALTLEASTAFNDEQEIQVNKNGHMEALHKRGRLRFIRAKLGYGNPVLARSLGASSKFFDDVDIKLARYLGITPNQIRRQDLRAVRSHQKYEKLDPQNPAGNFKIKERGRQDEQRAEEFERRFNALFTLVSIADRYKMTEDQIENRLTLERPNGKISNISIGAALRGGFPNIAVNLAIESVRQSQEMFGVERHDL